MKEYKLHLQVRDGHLHLIPQGHLTDLALTQLLGVARSGLTFFPVLSLDLRGVRNLTEAYLARLEEGFHQLISEKKLALTSERQRLRWEVGRPSQSHHDCQCRGHDCQCRWQCQDCLQRSVDSALVHKKAGKASGSEPS